MKNFMIGLVLGALVVSGILAALHEDPVPMPGPERPVGREARGSANEIPRPPVVDEPMRPAVPEEVPDSFAPGTAVLRIGDAYVFGEDRASSDDGDFFCQDIRHGASLRCPHGTLPVDVPLGAMGMPKQSAEVAALVLDAPPTLPRRDGWVRSHPTDQDAGVLLVRSAAGRTYKVWLVKEEPHPEALRRRVHLGWAEIPVKPGGGVARIATAKGIDAAGPTREDIRRIVAAGRAVPGDSFANFLSGAYVRPDAWPEKLVLREKRFLLSDESFGTEVEFNSRGGLYAAGGIGPKGRVVIRSYAGVAVRGAMEGVVDVKSYGYVHIAGDLTGEVNINSYATVVVDGDIVGTLKVRSYTNLLLHGRIRGMLDAKGSCWSTFYFDGYYSQADLMDMGGSFGSVTLHVKESDLAVGKHEKIGTWRHVIVGDKAWKKLAK